MTLAVPLVLDVFVLALLLVSIPAVFDTSLAEALTFQPDAPWIVLPLLLLAGIWGPLRTILLAALYYRGRHVRAAGAARTA